MNPTVGSLFSGIGGLDLGLERAGFRVIWQCETDDYARRVLEKHWPGVPKHGDIRDIDTAILPVPTLLCGGFPCQNISNAGKREGISGSESGLWNEYARIIRDLRPQFVLVENVPALRGRGLETVLGDLASCGYDAQWDCIPAAAVGAPHQRDRLFIVAHRQEYGWGAGRQGRSDSSSERQSIAVRPLQAMAHADSQGPSHLSQGEEGSERLARRDSSGRGSRGRGDAAMADTFSDGLEGIFEAGSETAATLRSGSAWWAVEPDVDRMAYGISNRVERIRGLGNAVVPQVAEYIGRQLMAGFINHGVMA